MQRGRARVDAARDGAAEVAERLVAARPETPLIDAGFELYERDSRIAGGMLAGAVAFRLFLLVVPLLLILVAGLGFLHASGTERSASTELGFSQTLVSTMSTVGQNAERGRWVTLWVGLVAAVFAVRTMIKSLRIVHNLAWGTTRKPSANRPVDLVVVSVIERRLMVVWIAWVGRRFGHVAMMAPTGPPRWRRQIAIVPPHDRRHSLEPRRRRPQRRAHRAVLGRPVPT